MKDTINDFNVKIKNLSLKLKRNKIYFDYNTAYKAIVIGKSEWTGALILNIAVLLFFIFILISELTYIKLGVIIKPTVLIMGYLAVTITQYIFWKNNNKIKIIQSDSITIIDAGKELYIPKNDILAFDFETNYLEFDDCYATNIFLVLKNQSIIYILFLKNQNSNTLNSDIKFIISLIVEFMNLDDSKNKIV
jgi:hypothetical protein